MVNTERIDFNLTKINDINALPVKRDNSLTMDIILTKIKRVFLSCNILKHKTYDKVYYYKDCNSG